MVLKRRSFFAAVAGLLAAPFVAARDTTQEHGPIGPHGLGQILATHRDDKIGLRLAAIWKVSLSEEEMDQIQRFEVDPIMIRPDQLLYYNPDGLSDLHGYRHARTFVYEEWREYPCDA